jgi:hypothetical protein
LSRVGIHDHFFALGGHSLAATRVIWQLSDRGVDIPLAAVFENPTVQALGEYIDADLLIV